MRPQARWLACDEATATPSVGGGITMPSFDFTITDAVGLHARPAAEFVRTAAGFASAVTVATQERSADAKSLLEVLQLQAGTGTTLTVSADGPDADEALAVLEAVLRGS